MLTNFSNFSHRFHVNEMLVAPIRGISASNDFKLAASWGITDSACSCKSNRYGTCFSSTGYTRSNRSGDQILELETSLEQRQLLLLVLWVGRIWTERITWTLRIKKLTEVNDLPSYSITIICKTAWLELIWENFKNFEQILQKVWANYENTLRKFFENLR